MNTETSSYFFDLKDFAFDFSIERKNSIELDFLNTETVLEEKEIPEL